MIWMIEIAFSRRPDTWTKSPSCLLRLTELAYSLAPRGPFFSRSSQVKSKVLVLLLMGLIASLVQHNP